MVKTKKKIYYYEENRMLFLVKIAKLWRKKPPKASFGGKTLQRHCLEENPSKDGEILQRPFFYRLLFTDISSFVLFYCFLFFPSVLVCGLWPHYTSFSPHFPYSCFSPSFYSVTDAVLTQECFDLSQVPLD